MNNPSSDWELYYRSAQNGGFNAYPERVTRRGFVPECSQPTVVAAGQVLKARSFVTSNAAGEMVACGNISEYAKLVMSGTAVNLDTVIMGGLTLTASATMTAEEIRDAFISGSTTKGTFTGALSGWELVADPANAATLWAYSTTGVTDVTDFVVTGTANTGTPTLTTTVTTVNGSATFQSPEGILAFDVDATAGATPASIYTEVWAYASEIVWAVDTAVDVLTKADGTTVACTTYNTGAGTSLLKQKLVAGTEFEIVIPTAGESLQHG